MSSILDVLSDHFDDSTVRQIGGMIGADAHTTERAISGALPVLIGALSRNASTPQGLESLAGALSRDHDGSLLDGLGGFLSGGGDTGLGGAILGHILGGKQDRTTSGLSRATGLDAGKIMKLLAILAPIVMAALGRAQRQRQGGPGGSAGPRGGSLFPPAGGAAGGGFDLDSLTNILTGDRRRTEQPTGGAGGDLGGLGGLLGNLLDRDGDGDASDEIADIGGGLLGSLLGGKR
jgi:hypothetical protein